MQASRITVFSVVCVCLYLVLAVDAHAVGAAEPDKEPRVDPAPCLAASEANEADRILTECGALIDNARTARSDRINALIARASISIRKGQADRAIADYDAVLRLDATLADIFNARGELLRKAGARPKALADFAAALKLNPEHVGARANYRSLAQELERLGARMAVAGKPSFNCALARLKVEKAICADPELADLDRDIAVVNGWVVRESARISPREARVRQREQDDYLAGRNAEFGHPGYDLKRAMRDRLQRLHGVDGY
jgi:tetratricopeptide (TPR) repeat protein